MEAHFATVWESIADEIGDHEVVVQGSLRRSWTEFDDRAARLAGALRAHGIGPGARIALLLFNSCAFIEAYTAALKIRAVPFNVNYRYVDDEIAYLLADADADALVFHSSLADRIERALARHDRPVVAIEVRDNEDHLESALDFDELISSHEPAPRMTRDGDDVTMIYTGGTTGMPKGVVSRIGPSVSGLLHSIALLVGLDPVDGPAGAARSACRLVDGPSTFVSLPAPPLIHNTGLGIGVLPALCAGGSVVLLPGHRFDPQELWDTVAAERATALTVVGDPFARPMLRALQGAPPTEAHHSVTRIFSSGAMFSAEVRTGLLERLPNAVIVDLIAATEGVMGTAVSTRTQAARTGSFWPAPGVMVINEAGRRIARGSRESGMIALPSGAEGYHNDPTKTATTFRTFGGRRYTVPGDHARLEADGSITLLGRGSQCINTGGEKVYPEEVEEAVKTHPDIDDCLVFGVDDEGLGQRVAAVASPMPGRAPEVDVVIAYLRERVAAYKVPRPLVIVADVPRTPVGKPDYSAAREQYESGH